MIIPTLVLVTAMQFGDPQSGAKIDDLTLSPWRDVPTANMVAHKSAYASPSDVPDDFPVASQEISPAVSPTVPPVMPTAPQTPGTSLSGAGGYALGIPDPDRNGNVAASPPPMPPQSTSITAPAVSYAPTAPARSTDAGSQPNVTSTNRYTTLQVGASEYTGPTKIENNKVYIRGKVDFDKITNLSAPIGGIVLELKTVKCDAFGTVQKGSNGDPIKIDLQRGVLLFTGQQVAQLDDRYPNAQYAVANTKLFVAEKQADQTIAIDYASAQLDTARSDLNRSLDANRRTPGVVPASELEFKMLKVTEAALSLEKARIDHIIEQESVKVQEQEVNVAKTQLDLRKVKTPFNAIVVNVATQVGNYLKEGDPIAQVAQLDKLKIVANVDGKQVTQQQVDGKRVTVKMENPNGRTEEFDGFVRYAAPIFSDNLRNFEVDIEVDNRLVDGYWQLSHGDFVDVAIHLN